MGELPLPYLITAIAINLNPTGRKQGLLQATLNQRLPRRGAGCQDGPHLLLLEVDLALLAHLDL